MKCEYCLQNKEIRPYGEQGKNICFSCMKSSAELTRIAEKNFSVLLSANEENSGIAILDGAEPRPATEREKSICRLRSKTQRS